MGRGSETQLQVSGNLNYLIYRFNPYSTGHDYRRQTLTYEVDYHAEKVKIIVYLYYNEAEKPN